jgi:hypothetical protein
MGTAAIDSGTHPDYGLDRYSLDCHSRETELELPGRGSVSLTLSFKT